MMDERQQKQTLKQITKLSNREDLLILNKPIEKDTVYAADDIELRRTTYYEE